MLEGRTVEDLRHISIAGGGLEINAAAYTTDDLRHIAIAGSNREPMLPQLILRNSNSKTTEDLRTIAIAGKGRVIFA